MTDNLIYYCIVTQMTTNIFTIGYIIYRLTIGKKK